MATAEQLNTIKDNWTKLTLKEIGELTGYSQSSVRRLGNKMGLVRGRSLSSWDFISKDIIQEMADKFYIGQKLKLKMHASAREEKIVDFLLGDIEIL